MKLDEVLSIQISQIPNFKGYDKPLTGQNIYSYYLQQTKHFDINTYCESRFQKVFDKVAKTQEEYDYLQFMSKQVSGLAQTNFEKSQK